MEFNLSTQARPAYRARGLDNLLRMGHCAPAVMQSVLEINREEQDGLVKLMAAMPGGIGNSGHECGGITSPLVVLGLDHGLGEEQDGLPLIFDQGHAFFQRFFEVNAASTCREIQNPRFPVRCIHAVRHSPELLAESLASRDRSAIPADRRKAYACLYAHMQQKSFHCAGEVFQQLGYTRENDAQLLDAASAFMGGTLFKGLTCGAYTAGVMAIGMKLGEIENSYLRVIHMLALMVGGGNAFGDDINKFNRALNVGHRLAKWFRSQFGSTQCRAVTGCDFSCMAGVDSYMTGGGLAKCRRIARRVAEQVKILLAEAG
jgi:C_GCAxxG_C_C family probable redox protein